MNTYYDYDADVVIAPTEAPIGNYDAWYAVWWGSQQIAIGTAQAMRLIASAASEEGACIYDVESKCFIAGTLEQLLGKPN
jgi:hypothetical protein